jgi:hypothetical protein
MSNSAAMRWWIAPPAPAETLRSVLARAAGLYHWEPQMLWRALNVDDLESCGSVDQPSCRAMVRIGTALGLPVADLRPHRVCDAPWRLAPDARQAMCPVCWEQAVARDEATTELRSWTHVLRTRCPIHQAPLCLPVSRRHAGTDAGQLAALSVQDWDVLALIERFGAALERSLFFGAPWPAGWRCSAQAARRLLVEATLYRGEETGFPLVANVAPSEALSPFVHGGRHRIAATAGRQDWSHFRKIADPATRRAALWATAWMVIPGLAQSLCPGWGMEAPLGLRRGSATAQ